MNHDSLSCPALFISAPASNQGKTTITAALARHHRRQGRRVRVFKTGPDFLDPMILARAAGSPVYSLHLWMVGETGCRQLLARAAADADLILIEGVMGLFDGKPSGADLATRFGVPVLAVIDAQAMAQTFGAIAFGLANFQPDLPFHGVFANRVGTQGHADTLAAALPPTLRWCGHMPTAADIALPDRHLGLTQADEIDDLDARLDRAADAIGRTPLAELPAPVSFDAAPARAPDADVAAQTGGRRLLEGRHIAIARDAAFSFLYPANLDLLASLGAQLSYFSPLRDEPVPAGAHALFLPGGYPELHLPQLTANARTQDSIRAHAAAGRTIVAECGGMLYLLDRLRDAQGGDWPMLGLLPGEAAMQPRLVALGMHRLPTACGELTGHTFHYSRVSTPLDAWNTTRHATRDTPGEAVYRVGPILATYFHAYWPSNPDAAAALFNGTAP
ncbi:MAG: cobyrinate a,c-diamide synthase [Janthinobacterium lividum]